MRIAVTSPDGIGDFILRVPLLLALEARGHSLLLIAQRGSLEIATLAGLRARQLTIESPYSKEPRRERNPFHREIRELIAFAPDRVFLAPFQPTFFEECVVAANTDLEIWGFECREGFWPSESIQTPEAIAARYSHRLTVSADLHESAKLDLAWQALSDESTQLPAWNLHIPQSLATSAATRLRDWNLDSFVMVCAGFRRGDHFLGWGQERWAAGLRALHKIHGLPYLFVGGPGERAAAREIFDAIGGDQAGHVFKVGEIDSLSETAALLARAKAYVGKDTSLLHLATALATPFLGIFGGGMWPRFVPRSGRGIALTAQMPCQGCNWRCHLPEPGCVVDLDAADLRQAWQNLTEVSTVEFFEKPYSGRWSKPDGFTDWLGYSRQQIQQRHERLQCERTDLLKEWWTLPRIRERAERWANRVLKR